MRCVDRFFTMGAFWLVRQWAQHQVNIMNEVNQNACKGTIGLSTQRLTILFKNRQEGNVLVSLLSVARVLYALPSSLLLQRAHD